MRLIVFAGPSLRVADRAAYPDVEWMPPAEAGDFLRLGAVAGDIVCLIDGYFDRRPAVRHKEVLLLLSRGVAVLGASSIGALRAAEMNSLGMIGVGAIYSAFARGQLYADDEVALVHAPQEWDWKPLSLPLVDCRAILCRAVRSGRLSLAQAREALRAAKHIHYADRDWPGVLDQTPICPSTREALLEWAQSDCLSQKRLDALACLKAASTGAFTTQPPPPMVTTSLLQALARERGVESEMLNQPRA